MAGYAADPAGLESRTTLAAPVLMAHDLGRRYGGRWAIRHVDLTLGTGQMVGIVGSDGAGKTTLLQMFAAILDPTEGSCRVFDLDTSRQSKSVASRIGYMSQGFTLYETLSVDENLRFSARIRSVPTQAYTQRRAELLDMAGLTRFTERPAGKLSGGMRKKLSLCTNLIHEPGLLILDEPGLGVDPLSRRQLWDMLEAFREAGIAIVVATSYMEEAERCDRVLLLEEGSVLVADTPGHVRGLADGRVLEIETEDLNGIARELERTEHVHGIQLLPGRVRFQLPPQERMSGNLTGLPRLVAPTLEDVFVLYSRPARESAPGRASPRSEPRESGASGIRAEGISVDFGGFRAVDRVSIEASGSELLALLGPNGAGKTTLIRAFCGLVPLSQGRAWVGGLPVGRANRAIRQNIGYMSQRFSLYPDLTAHENLAFFASAYGVRDAAAAIRWACETTALEADQLRVVVSEMSGATRQRLALGCSILHRPSVLFLDEPTSGVDPVSRYRFWNLIRELAASGMVIVVTTHYLDEATYCDRIGLMHRGRLIVFGSLDELRRGTASGRSDSVETVFINAIRQAEPEAI